MKRTIREWMKRKPSQKEIKKNERFIEDIRNTVQAFLPESEQWKMSAFKNQAGFLDYEGNPELDWENCTLNNWQLLWAAGIEDDDNYILSENEGYLI